MKKYQVLQGKMTNLGTGNLYLIKEFETLEAAVDYFNEIKNDKRGWNLKKNEHLETWLFNDWDDPVDCWSC